MPHADFRPSAGLLTEVVFPEGVRVDGWIETGTEVTPFYDPMLAKVIVSGESREAAIAAMQQALEGSSISGIETNLDYLKAIAHSDLFRSADVATTALKEFSFVPDVVEVIAPVRNPACRNCRDGLVSGMSACRRAGRWMSAPSATPTGWWAMPMRRRRWN